MTELLTDILAHTGIVTFPDAYSSEERQAIKAAVDPVLASRRHEARAYIRPDEISSLGILPLILSERMKAILFSIMPDPVLYHFHIYEIAENSDQSHIFGNKIEGWHRDEDCAYAPDAATHVSIFVYLTDVGADDGAFEFVPSNPTEMLKDGRPYVSVQGKAGFTFAWTRPFYHRASPNRGPVRRRLMKISIQCNQFPSAHLKDDSFQTLMKNVPPGNPEMDLLLGRYQGKTPPAINAYAAPSFAKLAPNEKLAIGNLRLLFVESRRSWRRWRKKLQHRLKLKSGGQEAYD